MSTVHYFFEDVEVHLRNPEKTAQWIERIVTNEGQTPAVINYIFCSDERLHQINQEYLKHDYYTDIITFDQSEEDNQIEGDIYISIDRVRENGLNHKIDFEHELHRVMIHGVLHLLGYSDKTDEEKQQMREKEDTSLSLYQF